MSKVRRLPALIVLPLLLLAGLVVQAGNDDPAGSDVRVGELTATAAAPGTPSSTWYCAAGSATGVTSGEGAGPAEQRVIVANGSDTDLAGTLTVFLETGAPTTVPIEVAAHSRVGTLVSETVKAPWAAVLVEITGGEVTVAHELTGPTGRSLSDCASTPSGDWYFPGGTTLPGTDMYLALFNPFPGEATVDVAFGTDSGARTPPAFQGIVVPGGSVVVQRVGVDAEVVPGEAHVSTTVSVRSGRIVAEQVQSFIGREEEGVPTVKGLTATIGATAPADVWAFPSGSPLDVDAAESVAVFNPGDTDTNVLVQVQIDNPEANGSVEPFEISVAAHRSAVVDVSADSRVPEGVPYWIIVRSTDGADVVAQRSLTGDDGAGIAYSTGLPVAATRWLAPVAVASGSSTSLLAIANPSATDTATVSVRGEGAGSTAELTEVPAESRVLAPGERLVLDLGALGLTADSSVEVGSDTPVVVAQWMTFDAPVDIATPLGVPVADTQSVLVDPVSPTVVGDEPVEDPSLTLPPDPSDTTPLDGSVDTTAADGSASSTTTTAPAASSTTTTAPGG